MNTIVLVFHFCKYVSACYVGVPFQFLDEYIHIPRIVGLLSTDVCSGFEMCGFTRQIVVRQFRNYDFNEDLNTKLRSVLRRIFVSRHVSNLF